MIYPTCPKCGFPTRDSGYMDQTDCARHHLQYERVFFSRKSFAALAPTAIPPSVTSQYDVSNSPRIQQTRLRDQFIVTLSTKVERAELQNTTEIKHSPQKIQIEKNKTMSRNDKTHRAPKGRSSKRDNPKNRREPQIYARARKDPQGFATVRMVPQESARIRSDLQGPANARMGSQWAASIHAAPNGQKTPTNAKHAKCNGRPRRRTVIKQSIYKGGSRRHRNYQQSQRDQIFRRSASAIFHLIRGSSIPQETISKRRDYHTVLKKRLIGNCTQRKR